MAVIIEGCTIVVQREAIPGSVAGGWDGFQERVSGPRRCLDPELVVLYVADLKQAEAVATALSLNGLIRNRNGMAIDFVVVDQLCGPRFWAPWLHQASTFFSRRKYC